MLDRARALTSAGISVLPIRNDGSKRPAASEWKTCQEQIANHDTLKRWFGNGSKYGIAAVGGEVSGDLECLDFDAPELVSEWTDLVKRLEGGAELLGRLVIVETPSGGRHYIYRCSSVEGNQKLAERLGSDGRPETLIETRGRGGYFVLPGSPAECHETGRPYQLKQGDLLKIPTITPGERDLLFGSARAFDELPKKVKQAVTGAGTTGKDRPGDDYGRATGWGEILEPAGWKRDYSRGIVDHWRRPGKSLGTSATTNYQGSDLLIVFSSNAAPFEPQTSYTKFAAYALLNHGGDFKAAARELRKQGFGKSEETPAAAVSTTAETEHRSDLGNARRLITACGQDIRYVSQWGWLKFDDRRWATDKTGEISRLAQQTVLGIHKQAIELGDPDQRQALTRHALKSEAAGRIQAMIKLAESQAEVVATPGQFDQDPWLFNVENYTINLKKCDVREHRREDLITKIAPVKLDPAARCPQFLKFLGQIMGENQNLIDFLQRAFGYALTGRDDEQCLFMLYGNGCNGKSTLLNTIRDVLGDYATVAQSESFLERDHDSVRNDLADLAGARFVTSIEIKDGRRLAEGLVKQLTGSDPVKARFLFHEHFVFRPTFKVFLAVNHRPLITGTDLAIWRRIRLVQFTVTISEKEIDRDLPQKLAEERPGILNWLLEGCTLWQRDGLGMPEEIRASTEEYRRDMDRLADWIEDCCVLDPEAETSTNALYASYASLSDASKEKPMSKKLFGIRMTGKGFVSNRSNRERMRRGIRLKHKSDASDASSGYLPL